MNGKSISLNGVDDSGKSTQIRLLNLDGSHLFYPTRPLITYSDRWTKCTGVEMSHWWFEQVQPEQLVDIMIESLNRRNADSTGGKIQLHDRGCRMFQAVCAATWTIYDESITLQDAANIVDALFAKKIDHDPMGCEILLQPNQSYFAQTKSLLAASLRPGREEFPASVNARYMKYQTALRQALQIYFSDPEVITIEVDSPICDVQNRIRKAISQKMGIEIALLANELRLMVGFGGLSESGKSSFAEYLRTHHAFTRLKLRYFIELLETKGLQRTDEAIVLELLLFLRTHYYIDRVSIESLHDPFVPAILKLMFGDRFRIVYLDAERTVRERRVLKQFPKATEKDLEEISVAITQKDETKISRGVLKIPEIADVILNNNQDDFQANSELLLSQLLTT